MRHALQVLSRMRIGQLEGLRRRRKTDAIERLKHAVPIARLMGALPIGRRKSAGPVDRLRQAHPIQRIRQTGPIDRLVGDGDHRHAQDMLRTGGGAAAAAAAVYFFDPQMGPRRRALVRDKLVRSSRKAAKFSGAAARDAGHRSYGIVARTRGRLTRDRADDRIITERVRAELGLHVRHPRSIEVSTEGARVRLCGPVLNDEVDGLLRAVCRIRGVRDVINDLDVHGSPGALPGLQGFGPKREPRFELRQSHWSPTARVLTAGVGLGLVGYGVRRRDVPSTIAGFAGMILAVRAVTNTDVRSLTGLGAGRNTVEIQKTVHVPVPVAEAYALWNDVERFPEFLSRVKEVRKLSDARSRWTVRGPAGVDVHWVAETTKAIPDQVMAWKTVDGNTIEHAGTVRFDPEDGGTRIHIRLSYNPAAGMLGHAVAELLGFEPRRQLDDDMRRMKTYLETGRKPHERAATITQEMAGQISRTRG